MPETPRKASPVRRPVVGVIGSGRDRHEARAHPLGAWIAESGFDLLTGGGLGVMESAMEGFHSVANPEGLTIGVIPCDPADPTQAKVGYPNPYVDKVIRTHLPGLDALGDLSRNPINVLTSSVIVSLPGGVGTRAEIDLALRYGKPIAAWLENPDELPGLSEKVQVVSTFAEVRGFVLERLRRGSEGER